MGKLSSRTKYSSTVHKAIVNLSKKGLGFKEIAEILGVGHRTIYHWLKVHEALEDDVHDALDSCEGITELSLFQLANGYSHPDMKVFYDQKTGEVVEHKITKHYPPNIQAIQFLLKNIAPDRWKDKHELGISKEFEGVDNLEEAAKILSEDPALLAGVIDVESKEVKNDESNAEHLPED